MISITKKQLLSLFVYLPVSLLYCLLLAACAKNDVKTSFDSSLAYSYIENQMDFGSRFPGSEGHKQTINYIQSILSETGWSPEVWPAEYKGMVINNIVSKRENNADKPWIILGAHYDTRRLADRDPLMANQKQPVPGANDGASGVAILLALAKSLPEDLPVNVWLVFFDAEDQGDIDEWEWIVGSTLFVEQLNVLPDEAIIVDMIGDSDLNIFFEGNSNPIMSTKLWKIAIDLGYSTAFIPDVKYSMIDDHTPFLQTGVNAVDIIDFDYPYWHTVNDTLDKVSTESLHAVGSVLFEYLTHYDTHKK